MSTWQATVRADASFSVLMSGENAAEPTESTEGTACIWCFDVCQKMSFGKCLTTGVDLAHVSFCLARSNAVSLYFPSHFFYMDLFYMV